MVTLEIGPQSVYLLYSFAAAKGPWAFDLARFTVIVAACIIIFYLPFVLRHFIDLYEHVNLPSPFLFALL
jgi:Na+/H+ antiporter NhaC